MAARRGAQSLSEAFHGLTLSSQTGRMALAVSAVLCLLRYSLSFESVQLIWPPLAPLHILILDIITTADLRVLDITITQHAVVDSTALRLSRPLLLLAPHGILVRVHHPPGCHSPDVRH